MGKWECISCNWTDDDPKNVDPYNDGGWQVCPECEETAVLRFNHPENQRQYAQALTKSEKFTCKRCGKELLLQKDIYKKAYKGYDTCLDCR